jgi:hypothetical protein
MMLTSYYDVSIAPAAEMSTVVPKPERDPQTQRALHNPTAIFSNGSFSPPLSEALHLVDWYFYTY